MRTVFLGLLGIRETWAGPEGCAPLILGFLLEGFLERLPPAFRDLGAGCSSSLSLPSSLTSSSDSISSSSTSSPSCSPLLRFGAPLLVGSGAYLDGTLTTRPERRREFASGSGVALALALALAVASMMCRRNCRQDLFGKHLREPKVGGWWFPDPESRLMILALERSRRALASSGWSWGRPVILASGQVGVVSRQNTGTQS